MIGSTAVDVDVVDVLMNAGIIAQFCFLESPFRKIRLCRASPVTILSLIDDRPALILCHGGSISLHPPASASWPFPFLCRPHRFAFLLAWHCFRTRFRVPRSFLVRCRLPVERRHSLPALDRLGQPRFRRAALYLLSTPF